MKTNLLGKIAMSISNLGKSKLDFSHPVSTTMSFGDIQPTHCKLVMPKSNGVIRNKSLVRFGTMIAPSFGKIKTKEYHQLVPMSDLFKIVAPLLAQAKVANAGNNIIAPLSLPKMSLGLLCRYLLIGSKIEIYKHGDSNQEGLGDSLEIFEPNNQLTLAQLTDALAADGISDWILEDSDNPNGSNPSGGSVFNGFHGTWFNLGKLTGNWINELGENLGASMWSIRNNDFWIPIANNDKIACYGYPKVLKHGAGGPYTEVREFHHIDLETCDACITFKVNGHYYTIAALFSAFGKRLRKAIIGSGKQINMGSYTQHEIVSLCAVWKAYFDLFALTKWTNYECTPLKRFTNFVDNMPDADGAQHNIDRYAYSNVFTPFIMELGRMWYTDQQDAIGAMVTSTANSPSLGLGNDFVDVDGIGAHIAEVDSSESQDLNHLNGHAFIDAIQHGQLDAEYLMKLYHWTNKNSVVGKEIEKVLRAQNLGDYVDSVKSNFIGYHEELMQISDVVSQADTFKDGEGSLLGTYGGRGLKLYETKDCKYSTDEYCYVVSLLTFVPESDFLESIDPQSYVLKKSDFLLPDFDGMGFEAIRKSIICGAAPWVRQFGDFTNNTPEAVAGLLPRGSHLKLAHTINNGDITLRSTRVGYLPYTVDKYVQANDYVTQMLFDNGNYRNMLMLPTIQFRNLPVGGWHYRYLCKYPWIGNFNRIFAQQGEQVPNAFWFGYQINAEAQELGFELCHSEFDNTIYHSLVYAPVWSPCKAIEESFETFEDGKKPNASTEHV